MTPDQEPPEFRFYYFTSLYEQTVGFYREILQLEVKDMWDRPDGDRGTVFRSPNGVGLIEIEAGEQAPSLLGGLYIEVADVKAWHDRLQHAGVPLTKELAVTSYGHRNFKVVDPSGVELCFFQHARSGGPGG